MTAVTKSSSNLYIAERNFTAKYTIERLVIKQTIFKYQI